MPDKTLVVGSRYTRFALGLWLALLLPGAVRGMEGLLISEAAAGVQDRPQTYLEGPFSNSTLPEQVQVESGKLGLVALHGANQSEGVPLYVVNRSNQDVAFHTYGGDPGIALEHRVEADGHWERAQPGGLFIAMCGDSLRRMVLKPGLHFKIRGYRPAKGTQGTVRFRLASHDLVSNEGPGLWSERDTGGKNLDWWLLADQPFARDLVLWDFQGGAPQSKSAERVLADLELMQVWEDRAVFPAFAQAFRAEVETAIVPDRAKSELLVAVNGLLQNRTAHDADPEGLFRKCVQILNSPRDTRFGSPGKQPEVAWEALQWLVQRKDLPHDARWQEVYQILRQRIPAADPAELSAMSGMIHGKAMVHEFLPGEFLIETTKSRPALMAACVERLASLQDWSSLTSIGKHLDAKGKQVVLAYFCLEPAAQGAPRRLRTNYEDEQEKFWEGCIETDPWRSVETMGRALGKFSEGYYLEPGLSLALLDQGTKFADRAALKPWPDQDGEFQNGLRQFIRIEGLKKTPKGEAILHRFRKLGETRPDGESDQQNSRRKAIAALARQQLLILGWDPEGGAGE